MDIFTITQHYRRGIRRCTLVMANALILTAMAGCDQAGQFARQVSGAGGVPGEIANACVVSITGRGLMHGYPLSDVTEVFLEIANPRDVSWEESHNGYIWRWTRHDELEQADYQVAIEFIHYSLPDFADMPDLMCGPTMLRPVAAIINGEQIGDIELSKIFGTVNKTLYEREDAEEQPAPSPEQASNDVPTELPVLESPAPFELAAQPVTKDWLVGSWAPIDGDGNAKRDLACASDIGVTHNADGTYRTAEGYGRFRTDGRTVTYFNQVDVDPQTRAEDRSSYRQPTIADAARIDPETVQLGSRQLRRCSPN